MRTTRIGACAAQDRGEIDPIRRIIHESVNSLTAEGMLPDLYGKFAPEDAMIDGHPSVSFPIDISDVPENAVSLALAFVDFDAVPVGGFCWIHWLACNIDPAVGHIP